MDVLNTFHHTLLVWRRFQWFHQDRVPFLLVTAHVSRSRTLPYLGLNCQKARCQAHCLLKQKKCIKIYRSVIYRRVLLLYCIENIKMLLFLRFTGQLLDKFGSVTGSQIEVAKRWGLGKERLEIFSSSLLCSHWPRLKKWVGSQSSSKLQRDSSVDLISVVATYHFVSSLQRGETSRWWWHLVYKSVIY